MQESGQAFKIKIDFSTNDFCYVVVIHFDSFKSYYNDSLQYAFINTTPTANIKDSIETAIKLLKNCKKQELATIQQTKPEQIEAIPEPEPKIKQITIREAIETEQTKAKKEKK